MDALFSTKRSTKCRHCNTKLFTPEYEDFIYENKKNGNLYCYICANGKNDPTLIRHNNKMIKLSEDDYIPISLRDSYSYHISKIREILKSLKWPVIHKLVPRKHYFHYKCAICRVTYLSISPCFACTECDNTYCTDCFLKFREMLCISRIENHYDFQYYPGMNYNYV